MGEERFLGGKIVDELFTLKAFQFSDIYCWLATDVTAAMLGDKNEAFLSAGN